MTNLTSDQQRRQLSLVATCNSGMYRIRPFAKTLSPADCLLSHLKTRGRYCAMPTEGQGFPRDKDTRDDRPYDPVSCVMKGDTPVDPNKGIRLAKHKPLPDDNDTGVR